MSHLFPRIGKNPIIFPNLSSENIVIFFSQKKPSMGTKRLYRVPKFSQIWEMFSHFFHNFFPNLGKLTGISQYGNPKFFLCNQWVDMSIAPKTSKWRLSQRNATSPESFSGEDSLLPQEDYSMFEDPLTIQHSEDVSSFEDAYLAEVKRSSIPLSTTITAIWLIWRGITGTHY